MLNKMDNSDFIHYLIFTIIVVICFSLIIFTNLTAFGIFGIMVSCFILPWPDED